MRNLYSREAYCEAHFHNFFQKIQKFIAFTAAYPKSQNSIYGTHSPLGVKRIEFVQLPHVLYAKNL
jgi:hypothetical protein